VKDKIDLNEMPKPLREKKTDSLRVLIADDHRMVGEVVAEFLVASGDFRVDLSDTLDKTLDHLATEEGYDIVMLDLVMPGMVGTDGIRRVVKACSTGVVVLFSSRVDRFTLDRSLELGVKGVIPKTMPARSLISALKLIHSGEVFLPSNTIENLMSGERKADMLTEAELFILRLAAKGLTNKQIANDMGQTETAIKMYMRSICTKLEARNRAHAAMIGRDLSLLDA
jgi:two-component system, NarL family, nitrate/nitrite response regulator NarL